MFVPILTLFLSAFQAGTHAGHPNVVTVKEAEALLSAALPKYAHRLTGLGFEQYQDRRRFIYFTVTWAAPAESSVVVGNYAVDPYTGDVWSAAISCDELTTPSLHRLQKRVRAELGLSASDYRKVKAHGPLCDR